jgi:ABC-type lipopolysaccharide export system ATPase subunit
MATLRTTDLSKSFGGRTVVRGVSLEIASGEVVGLLGPNGAGKTTTFSMVVGLTAPDSGRVLLDGSDVTEDPMYVRARKGIGYLPQEPRDPRDDRQQRRRSPHAPARPARRARAHAARQVACLHALGW